MPPPRNDDGRGPPRPNSAGRDSRWIPLPPPRKDASTEGELQRRRGETRFVRVENAPTGPTPDEVIFQNHNELEGEGNRVEEE